MRFVARLMRFHIICYSTFLHVILLRKLELQQKHFVACEFATRTPLSPYDLCTVLTDAPY
jgi:hypothetical protein